MKPLLELLNYLLQQSNVPMINMIFPSTICFIISILIFFYIARRRNKLSDHHQPKFPPSPPRLPLLGNFHQLSSLPFRSLKELSDKYGPLMIIHFGCKPVLIVSSAEAAREVMKTHDLTFAGRPVLGMVERLMYNCDLALAPYGEYWRQVRRIAVLHLLSVKRVESFRAAREEEVSLLVEKIRASISAGRPVVINVSEMSIGLTNDVISRAALGRKYSREEEAGVHATLKEFTALMGSYLIGDFIPWFGWIDAVRGLNARVRKNFRQVDCFLERVLDEHLHSKTKTQTQTHANFMDVLLALNDDAHDDAGNISLTRDNIKAIILDMFLGGTDTTSTTIEWTMSELIRNPEVMRRLQQEVRATVGWKEKVTEEDLEKMNYLKAVIKETLRLHPPIPMLVPRETIEQVELRGYEIPAGTQVMINAWTIGRDPVSWGDRPGEYFPDRFMNTSTSTSSSVDFRGKDFQLIPFGSGRRGCPGLGFAIAMIQVTLANLLCHFDWELPDGMRGEALDMTEIQDVTVHRKSDLILVATPRLLP